MTALIGKVEAFAEIGDYIDQPVRTYSSGMQVRLAFSVATAVRPDVLIVDEALSVGDAYFQHKSFDRIRRFRDQGTTLLFVSHSPGAVKTLCDRAILLDRGQMLRDESPDAVFDYYNAMIAAQRAEYDILQSRGSGDRAVTRSGTGRARIESVELLSGGEAVQTLRSGAPATIRLTIAAHSDLPKLTAGILIRDRLGNDVFGTNTFHHDETHRPLMAGDRLDVEFKIPHLDLGVGSFSLSVALHAGATHTEGSYDWWDRALVFQVVRGAQPMSVGVCAFAVDVRWLPRAIGETGDSGASKPESAARIGEGG